MTSTARFDLIAANPPYVKDATNLASPPTCGTNPTWRLFGGDDGLRDVEGVLDTAAARSCVAAAGW